MTRFASLLAIGTVALAAACRSEPQRAPATLALQSCRVEGLSRDALCGTHPVLEDRSNPEGRTIDLRVVVVPARGRAARPDPVFFLAGGPGQGATEAFPPLLAAYEELGRDRDIVLVDIRGTGSSSALDCEQPEDLAERLDPELHPEDLKACLAGLPGDPVQHTTRNAVEDLDEVRQALGYDQINLVGGSYGTRLGLEIARHHGDHVRAMVLDGVAPPQMALPEGFAVDAQAALGAAFGACADDAACHEAFPDPAADLQRTVEALDRGPVTVEATHPRTGEMFTVDLSRDMFAGGLRGVLYSTELTSLMPLALHQAARGEYAPFVAQSVVFADSMGDTMSTGLMLSILCAEDLPRIDEAAQRMKDAATFLGTMTYDVMREACELWPHAPLPETAGQPVESDVPTFLLSGAADPVTPPRWAELAAESLSRSTHVVVPNVGHGTLTRGCVPGLVTDFLDTADPAAVDASCAEDVRRPPFFIDLAGPAH